MTSTQKGFILPYGIYARVLFVYICTTIVQNKTKQVNFGPSLKAFVENTLERPWVTGRKGTAEAWRSVFLGLLTTVFTATYKINNKEKNQTGLQIKNLLIANDVKALWGSDEYDEDLGAEFTVSDEFYDLLSQHSTPLSATAIKNLANTKSSLAFDLYCWLTWRYFSMEQSGAPFVRIKWSDLHKQMGGQYTNCGLFRTACRSQLESVKIEYNGAIFDTSDDRFLILFKSKPHIAPARVKKVLTAPEPEEA